MVEICCSVNKCICVWTDFILILNSDPFCKVKEKVRSNTWAIMLGDDDDVMQSKALQKKSVTFVFLQSVQYNFKMTIQTPMPH
jgi:hypothetical protein